MADSNKPKAHIIYLLADQLRHDVLGTCGGTQCPTPKLDLLGQRATIFQRHFTPCPLCRPARSSIVTGLVPARHGAIINGWLPNEQTHGMIRNHLQLLPQKLVEAGYHVVHVGVQNVQCNPGLRQRLADVEFHGPTSPGQHLRQLTQRGLMFGDLASLRDPVIDFDQGKPIVYSGLSPRTAPFPLRENLFYDCALAQRMVKTIKEHSRRDDDKPLALFGMFWLPHPPMWAPQKWANLIDPQDVHLPATVGKWYNGMAPTQLANVPGQLGAHVSIEQWKQAWAMYMGMTALLDQCVGQVLAALDKRHMFDDSLIAFTSDHGEMLGSHKLYQKMCLYEEAVRVPLLLKMPGQKQSRQVWDLTDHLDLTATLLDIAQAQPLPDSPGQSLNQLAQGITPQHQTREMIFATYDGNAGRGFGQRMARSRSHKLIHVIGDHGELYDLVDDPRETRNLIGQPEVAQVERQLRDALNKWMDQHDDPLPRC